MDISEEKMEIEAEENQSVHHIADEIRLQDYPDSDGDEGIAEDIDSSEIPKIIIRDNTAKQADLISEEQKEMLYRIMDIPIDTDEQSNRKLATWRLSVVHTRGVQEMNTEDVINYFNEYEPEKIEWVNDLACNVLFSDALKAATAISGLSEALVLHQSENLSEDFKNEIEVIDAGSLEVSVPPYRWRLGKPHDKAKCILLRFATITDRKMQGARKHSQFYQKYGIPGDSESNRLSNFKHKRTPRVHNPHKMRNNLERLLYVSPTSHGLPMKMRADEEEHKKKTLADRIDVPVSRRISFGSKRPSVWDRLESGKEELRITSRSVEVGRRRLRVVSRVSNSRNGSIFRRL